MDGRDGKGNMSGLVLPVVMLAGALVADAVHRTVGGHGIPSVQLLEGAGALSVVAGWVFLARPRATVRPGTLGSARRARGRDLRELRGGGPRVRLGTHHLRAVRAPADEHLLALGPTGAGKSSAVAIPAILDWPGAVVATDPKAELLRSTLEHRRRRGPVAVFAPLMYPADRWNPVASIQSSEDALRTAQFLMGRPPDREPFWHELALQLLHGLLVEASCSGMTPARLLALLQEVPAEELASAMANPLARSLVQGSLSGGDRTAMGVVATLVARLGVFGADQVAQATSVSTFDPRGIAKASPATIYCVVSPPDAPLLRGLLSALLAACWRAVFFAPPSTPVLFVLDEFAQLTALPELPALVQLGRSQGVRMVLLAQDLASVSATYGTETVSALWSNCRTKLLLPGISEIDLLDRTSRLAGSATHHRSEVGSGWQPIAAHPVLPPDDIRRLGRDRALVLRGSDHPAVIRQRPWYADRRLRRLVGRGARAELLPQPVAGRPLMPPTWEAVPLPWGAAAEPLDAIT